MSEKPNQPDVDAVAHFVQAARDLKASPFFIEEHRLLGVTYNNWRDGQVIPITYRLPDPRVRDAMVISFRRIWMPGEPGNFERGCNILKRYVPRWRPLIDFFKNAYQQARQKYHEPFMRSGDDPGITPEAVIDMWLNCRLAHGGASATKGKFSRSDYEREAARLGEAKFEYLFLFACFHAGLCYFNLLRLAEDILCIKWAAEGLKPSFVFEDDIARAGTGECRDGVRLERSTPGITVLADDLPAQLKLLRRRRAFAAINDFLEMLSVDNNSCVHLLRSSADVDNLLNLAGLDRETLNDVPSMEGVSQIATFSDEDRQSPPRKGMIARFHSTIKMVGHAQEILDEQLVGLKEALFRGGQVSVFRQ